MSLCKLGDKYLIEVPVKFKILAKIGSGQTFCSNILNLGTPCDQPDSCVYFKPSSRESGEAETLTEVEQSTQFTTRKQPA